jgi:hypothetical protein
MTKRAVRAYDYVNHRYEHVRDALKADALGIFQQATHAAEARGGEVAASLSVDVSGLQVSKDIDITVGAIHEDTSPSAVTHVELEWRASESPRLFPVMKGDLKVYPLTATETLVDFNGEYEPPMGLIGGAIDAVVGHRLAEASVHRFVVAVVERLRQAVVG